MIWWLRRSGSIESGTSVHWIRENSRDHRATSNRTTKMCDWVCVFYNLCITSIFCIFIFFIEPVVLAKLIIIGIKILLFFIKTFFKISNFVRMPTQFCSEVLEGCIAWQCHLIPCSRTGLWKRLSSYRGFLGIRGVADGRFESTSYLLLVGFGYLKHLMLVPSFHCSTCSDFAWLGRCSLVAC